MSASMFMNESAGARASEPPAGYPTKLCQLAVAREMVASLATLTCAGQRYMMGKILALLEAHVAPQSPPGSSRNHHTLSDLIARLGREVERLWPDVDGFSRRAENLLGLLTAVA